MSAATTHTMLQGDLTQVYTADYWRPIICAIYIFILIAMSVVTGRRTPGRLSTWKHLQMSNVAVVLSLNSSLLFVALTTLTTLGLGTSRNIQTCTWTFLLCVIFYSLAKLFTAWFLIERARLVSAPLMPRMKNKLYLFNCALSSLWGGILIIMILNRHAEIRADGECRIGMGRWPVAGVMMINAFLEFYYCSLFALPLYRGNWANPRLRRLAIRTIIAALLSVSSSLLNLSILLVHNGHELSWLCTTTCSTDTVWCALVLCSLTGKKDDRAASPEQHKTGKHPHLATWRTNGELTSVQIANKSRRASAVSANLAGFTLKVDRAEIEEEADEGDEESRDMGTGGSSVHRSSVGSEVPVLLNGQQTGKLSPTPSNEK